MTYKQVCDQCNREYISANPESLLCGLCKAQAAKEGALERLEDITRKLGAENVVSS